MKIICDNQKEYDELMKDSEYFHYMYNIDTDYNEVVNFLCHLYLVMTISHLKINL